MSSENYWYVVDLALAKSVRERELLEQISSYEKNCLKSSVRERELFEQISSYEKNCLKSSVREQELFEQISSLIRTV